jgi:hypothetical protein
MRCATWGLQLKARSNDRKKPMCVLSHAPEQDDVRLLHRRDILSDGDFDSLSSNERSECPTQTLGTCFAVDARDETGGQCWVALGDVRRGGGPRRVRLPLGIARAQAVQWALRVKAGEHA